MTNQLAANKGKGNRDGINCRQISAFRIPLPPIKEAREIRATIDSFWVAENTYDERKRQLVAVKEALMSDLLTGRKRVPLAELAAAE